MALVLGETTAGALALLWLAPLWNEVKRGYFKLTGSVLVVLAFLTWFSANTPGVSPGDEARRGPSGSPLQRRSGSR